MRTPIVPSGTDRVIVSWQDVTTTTRLLRLQCYTSAGAIAPGWPSDGIVAAEGASASDFTLLADGSGLSRRNLVQPRQLAALLVAIAKSERLRPIAELLPVGGKDGTLVNRLRGNATAGHVRAKTGFVSYVACLSGYVDRPADRPPLVFSIMLNNFTCPTDAAKAAIDAFVARLCVASGWSE